MLAKKFVDSCMTSSDEDVVFLNMLHVHYMKYSNGLKQLVSYVNTLDYLLVKLNGIKSQLDKLDKDKPLGRVSIVRIALQEIGR